MSDAGEAGAAALTRTPRAGRRTPMTAPAHLGWEPAASSEAGASSAVPRAWPPRATLGSPGWRLPVDGYRDPSPKPSENWVKNRPPSFLCLSARLWEYWASI